MTDDVKAALMQRCREWLQSCVNAATRSGVPEEADLEAFLLAHIDGEPARTQAACDRRAEEVREACARSCPACRGKGFVMRVRECPFCSDSTHDHECPTDEVKVLCLCGAERIRGLLKGHWRDSTSDGYEDTDTSRGYVHSERLYEARAVLAKYPEGA